MGAPADSGATKETAPARRGKRDEPGRYSPRGVTLRATPSVLVRPRCGSWALAAGGLQERPLGGGVGRPAFNDRGGLGGS